MHSIRKLVVGFMQSNCYILTEGDSAIVIDPGGDAQLIIDNLNQLNTKCIYIINTHGHIDHIAANNELKEKTGAKILIHKEDAKMLTDSFLNLSAMLGGQMLISSSADRLLEDGDYVEIPNIKLKVLHTPGHTPGGICLLGKGLVFTGDTLFEYGIGRTDFPGSSYKTLINSITKSLLTLENNTVIYPGHGDTSTIGKERENNPFLQ